MPSPRSVRFNHDVLERLNAYARTQPDVSISALTNRFVDEALRMEAHPGVIFRDGPAGRRPVLVGGPDVWEVVRAAKEIRAREPKLDQGEVIGVVVETSGVPLHLVRVAIDYWSEYADEVDAWIDAADASERNAHEQWLRRRKLLAS